MSESAEAAFEAAVRRLALSPGQVVQEIGYDEDADAELRDIVQRHTEAPLEDEEYDGGADAVLLWWREGDGDLTDDLMDSLGNLADGGSVILLTPRGRDDVVDPADIEDAASTAGLRASKQISVAPGWFATRLVSAGSPRR